jgi:hypothetical protein
MPTGWVEGRDGVGMSAEAGGGLFCLVFHLFHLNVFLFFVVEGVAVE